MKSRGNGSFRSEFMAVLLRIELFSSIFSVHVRATRNKFKHLAAPRDTGNLKELCRFVTTKKKKRKPDRNYDAVATGIPRNKRTKYNYK